MVDLHIPGQSIDERPEDYIRRVAMAGWLQGMERAAALIDCTPGCCDGHEDAEMIRDEAQQESKNEDGK